MREIKFRAFSPENGMEYIDDWYWFEERGVHDYKCEDFYGKNYKIMQFTGMKDKNGKEIYEGDIVKVGTFALNDVEKFGSTPWNNLPIGIKEDDITTIERYINIEFDIKKLYELENLIKFNPDVTGVEIIGNIYENS